MKLLITLALLLTSCSATPNLYDLALKTQVVRLWSQDGHTVPMGTGFCLAHGNKILMVTARHNQPKQYPGMIQSEPLDLAAWPEPLCTRASKISDSRDDLIGDLVVIPGYSDSHYSTVWGLVSEVKDQHLILNVVLKPGASGSPVLNQQGDVVGVVIKRRIAPPHHMIAVTGQALRHWLDEAVE